MGPGRIIAKAERYGSVWNEVHPGTPTRFAIVVLMSVKNITVEASVLENCGIVRVFARGPGPKVAARYQAWVHVRASVASDHRYCLADEFQFLSLRSALWAGARDIGSEWMRRECGQGAYCWPLAIMNGPRVADDWRKSMRKVIHILQEIYESWR